MQKQLFLYLLAFCIVGIALADYFHEMLSAESVLFGLSILVFILILQLLAPKLFPAWGSGIVLGGIFSFLFAFYHLLSISDGAKKEYSGKQLYHFQLVKKLNSTERYRKYEVEIIAIQGEESNESFKALFNIPKDLPELDFFHTYQAESYIHQMRSTALDFQFDYSKYLARQGIYYQSFVSDYYEISAYSGFRLSQWIKQQRLQLLQRINAGQLSSTTKLFLKGIILADRTEMEQEMILDFRRTGLMHLLAISGGHIVVIFGLIFFLLKYGVSFVSYRWRLIISLCVVWLFTIFIDLGNSVVRSSLMLSMYYGAILLQRPPNLFHSASISALLMLLIDTNAIFDVGFQMSYTAVFGIGLFYAPLLKRMYGGVSKWKRNFFSIISITIAAQIGTFSVVLYHFHQYALVSFFANLIIVPFAEILIVISCFMVVFYAVGTIFNFLEWAYDTVVQGVLWLIHHLGAWEVMFVEYISFGILELIMVYFCIYLFYRYLVVSGASFLPLVIATISFLILRLGIQMYWDYQSENISMQFAKQKVQIVKDRRKVYFMISGKPSENFDDEKFRKFVMMPYLTSRRVSEVNTEVYFSESTSF